MKFVIFSDERDALSHSPNGSTLAKCLHPHRLSGEIPVFFFGECGYCAAGEASIAVVWDPGYKATGYPKPDRNRIVAALRPFLGHRDVCQPLVHIGSEHIHEAQIGLIDATGGICRPPVLYRHQDESFEFVCRLLEAASKQSGFNLALEQLERCCEPLRPSAALLRAAETVRSDAPSTNSDGCAVGSAGAALKPVGCEEAASALRQAACDWHHGLKGARAQIVGATPHLASGAPVSVRRDAQDAILDIVPDYFARHERTLEALANRCEAHSPAAAVAAAAVQAALVVTDRKWREARLEATRGSAGGTERLGLLLQDARNSLVALDRAVETLCRTVEPEPILVVPTGGPR